MSAAAAIIRAGAAADQHPWPRHVLSRERWQALAAALNAADAPPLQGLWAEAERVHALFLDAGSPLSASIEVAGGTYPALSPHGPAASWFERMIHDLFGHVAEGGRDPRPWLDHGAWSTAAPLGPRQAALPPRVGAPEPPEFLQVEGEDLNQIGLGPVAGAITEPAHLRLTAQGETLVRLEVRLGYAHKGTLGLMRGTPPRVAARFAARLSGGSTVAHGLAYAHAIEAALGVTPPPRAVALRAVMAELERIRAHLDAATAIAAEAGSAFLEARFGWHREAMLEAGGRAFGHRLMMDGVAPGGLATDITADGADAIRGALGALERELPELARILERSASLGSRIGDIGRLASELVARFGASGPVRRACGLGGDARLAPGYPPYATLGLDVPTRSGSDVAARLRVRLDDVPESTRLLRALLAALPDGTIATALPAASGEGLGVAEASRGTVWHWVRIEGGLVAGAFARDPDWSHWPLLEAAMRNGLVADLPLCAASFGLTSSGVDL